MKKLLLLFISVVLLFSCVTMTPAHKVSSNKSEHKIENQPKSYIVLGNLRVVVGVKDNYFDKIMTAAISQYGQGVDVINIKEDYDDDDTKVAGEGRPDSPIIINCLVIKYD